MNPSDFEKHLVDYALQTEPERISKKNLTEYFCDFINGPEDSQLAQTLIEGFIPILENDAISPLLADSHPRSPKQENCLSLAVLMGFTQYSILIGDAPADYTDMYNYADHLRGKDPVLPSNERLVGEKCPRSVFFNALLSSGENLQKARIKLSDAMPELYFAEEILRESMSVSMDSLLKNPHITGFDLTKITMSEYMKKCGRSLGEAGELLHDNFIAMEARIGSEPQKRVKIWQAMAKHPSLATSMSQDEIPAFLHDALKANIEKKVELISKREINEISVIDNGGEPVYR